MLSKQLLEILLGRHSLLLLHLLSLEIQKAGNPSHHFFTVIFKILALIEPRMSLKNGSFIHSIHFIFFALQRTLLRIFQPCTMEKALLQIRKWTSLLVILFRNK